MADLFRQIGYDERLHKLESEANLAAPRFRDSTSPTVRLNAQLKGDDAVGAGDECCDVSWSRPRPVQCGEVVVGCPPGNCTTLSNVYEDSSFDRFRDEVAQRW